MNRKKNTAMIETVMEDLVQEYQQESSLSEVANLLDESAENVLSIESEESESAIKEHISADQEKSNLSEIDASVETGIPFLDQKEDLSEKEIIKSSDTEIMSLMEFKPNESGLTSENKEKTKKKLKKHKISSTSASNSLTTQLKPENLNNTASIIQMPLKEKKTLESPPSPSFSMDGNVGLATHSYQKNQETHMPIQISLQQSENLSLAQERMTSLEEEIERLRQENEKLITTANIFKERLDKVLVKNDDLKKAYEESREEFLSEKKVLMNTLSDQSREMDKMQVKNKELEKRLSNNLQHIRIREKELENRLELVKVDSQTLVREKNRYILQLKQQIERSKMDLNTHKDKYSELQQKLEEHLEQSRRAVRGIQMVTHILKGRSLLREEDESIESKIKSTDEDQI